MFSCAACVVCFFPVSRSGDARARWTPGRRNSSLSSTGPADTFPYSPSERSGSEDELWGALEQRSSAEGDGDNVAAGVMGRDGSKHACRDVSVGTAARRAMPREYIQRAD